MTETARGKLRSDGGGDDEEAVSGQAKDGSSEKPTPRSVVTGITELGHGQIG